MDNNTIVYIVIAVLVYMMYSKNSENVAQFHGRLHGNFHGSPFCNHDGHEASRCTLVGTVPHVSDIRHKYIYPESNFRLNASSGVMYESRRAPRECASKKVGCPAIFGRKDGLCHHCAH